MKVFVGGLSGMVVEDVGGMRGGVSGTDRGDKQEGWVGWVGGRLGEEGTNVWFWLRES